MKLFCNCCDGVYNSFDVHFTSSCDNKCRHCIDNRFSGIGIKKPDVKAIAKTISLHASKLDDVLFLGGEPCLYLEELLECVRLIKATTTLKVFVTTSVPMKCYTDQVTFFSLIEELDGLNISVQHHNEDVADKIRGTKSFFDRQKFYKWLPNKQKIRVNLNIVKPYLHTRKDISDCLIYYDSMGFNSIKLSEIQHGKDVYVSFCDVFGIKLPSAYSHGCQMYIETSDILPELQTPVLLKRSCFLCEDSLNASLADGVKMAMKLFKPSKNKYGVVYEDGSLQKGWV